MAAVRSHSLSIGIVGLPNAGKSSLFNAITKNSVPAENFPFCTIDKNVGVVKVEDPRLDLLERFFKALKVVPSAITFVDIAGLVKGASKGEGLGNQFLGHIREVDVILYVLRSFKSDNVVHVYDRVDPVDDFQIVQAELILKDLEVIGKKVHELEKVVRTTSDSKVHEEYNCIVKIQKTLNEGKPAIELEFNEKEREIVEELFLLTYKKRIYLLNTKAGLEDDQIDKYKRSLTAVLPKGEEEFIIPVDIKLISEISEMNQTKQNEYFDLLGYKPVMLNELIKLAFTRLDLVTFYTGSEKEVNAWSVRQGASAKEAAGVIHTDLMNGFITADIVKLEDLFAAGGWNEAKEKGLIKNQGKDYIVKDGDYMIVHSNL